ncbi:MAG: AsmA family protein [Rhizobiaceae bacterium]|nr:AsmA family protein [Rhizobiaceae bacterium]
MLGRIFVVIGGLLVVALFAALLAPYFIDWTNFRRDFEIQASRIIGKKVVVHGKVDARLLPFPSVTMNDVRVGEDGTGESLVTAESFSMESELAPFLSGQALIYNMRIDKPKVRLKLTGDGTLDWVRTGNPDIPASTVILENVTVTGGDILFIDEQTGRSRHLTGLDMALSAKTLAGPWRVSGKGAIDGIAGSFVLSTSIPDKGAVPLKLRLLPDQPSLVAELEGVIRLAALRPEYKGRFSIREKFRSETDASDTASDTTKSTAPRIAGAFELMNDRLRIPEYEFKMGDPDDPYTVKGEATIDVGRNPEFLVTAEGHQIDMSRFGGNGEGMADSEAVPLMNRIRAFLTLAADMPIPNLPGRASIRLPAIVAGDTTLRDIRLEMSPAGDGWQIDRAEAQLPGRTTLSASGKLTLLGAQSFEGDLLLASNQPSGFAEWITGSVPDAIRRLKTAGFEARVSLTPELQRFENLEIAFGPASLRGRLEHELISGQPPSLSVDLAGNAFDLDTMLALGSLMTGEATTAALSDNRIAARLKVDHFRAFDLDATGLDAAFSVANGALGDVRATIGDFYGTALDIKGGFADIAGQPKGGITAKLKSADPAAFLRLLSDRLPPHPALRRLTASAAYYADTELTLGLKLGLGDWPVEATLDGTANGSRLTARLASQEFDFTDPDGLTLDASIENPKAWIMLGQAGLPTIDLDADEDGLLSLKIEQSADAEPQVTLDYSSGTTTVNIEGAAHLASAGFLDGSYQLTVDSGDIAPYLMMTGLTLPRLIDGLSLNATANIYASPDGISIDSLKGHADSNSFNGVLNYPRQTPDPRFEGRLTLGTLDLGWLADAVYGPVTEPLTEQLSRIDIPRNAGLPFNVDLALAAGEFHLGALGDVKRFNGKLRSTPGKIEIDEASGQLADGNFTGHAELGNIDGTAFLRSQMKVTGASLATTFWRHDGKPVAAALSDLSFAIDTTGKSAVDLLESATGSGTLTLSNLTVTGFDGGSLDTILKLADGVDGELNEAALRPGIEKEILSGATRIDRLEIPFNIAGGRLRAANVAGQNRDMSFAADADIGLLNGDITATLTAELKPGEEQIAGAEPSVSLHWQGPLAAPDRTADITAIDSFLSLRRFEQERRRVEIMQANIAEKQRLRREAALYRSLDAERKRLEQRARDNERLLKAAQEALKAQARTEAEARRRARAEKQKKEDGADMLKFDTTPGLINQ